MAVGQAMKVAINAQYALNNTTVNVTSADNSAAVTLVNSKLGASGTLAGYSDTAFAAGLTQGAETPGVDAGYTATDVTTRGTLTLSSGTGFTVAGSAAADGGLSASSAALTTLSTVNLSTVAGANSAISLVDGALSQVNTMRAGLGASASRFLACYQAIARMNARDAQGWVLAPLAPDAHPTCF